MDGVINRLAEELMPSTGKLRRSQGVIAGDHGDGRYVVKISGSSVATSGIHAVDGTPLYFGDTVWLLADKEDFMILGHLALNTYDTGWITSTTGFTLDSDWSLDDVRYRVRNGMCTIYFTVTREGGPISNNAAGNISNSTVFTAIPTAIRPDQTAYGGSVGTGRGAFWTIGVGGTVTMNSITGTSDFATDETAGCYTTYPLLGPGPGVPGSGGSLIGPPGVGVPPGGSTGMVLAKNSGADYDTHWITFVPGLATTLATTGGTPIVEIGVAGNGSPLGVSDSAVIDLSVPADATLHGYVYGHPNGGVIIAADDASGSPAIGIVVVRDSWSSWSPAYFLDDIIVTNGLGGGQTMAVDATTGEISSPTITGLTDQIAAQQDLLDELFARPRTFTGDVEPWEKVDGDVWITETGE